jgi:hypothetical protein
MKYLQLSDVISDVNSYMEGNELKSYISEVMSPKEIARLRLPFSSSDHIDNVCYIIFVRVIYNSSGGLLVHEIS